MKCPGCGYVRKTQEDYPDWQCPFCKIAYNKHPDYIPTQNLDVAILRNKYTDASKIHTNIIYLYTNNDAVDFVIKELDGRIIEGSINEEFPNRFEVLEILNDPTKELTKDKKNKIIHFYLNKYSTNKVNHSNSNSPLRYVLISIILIIIFYIFFHVNENSYLSSKNYSSQPTPSSSITLNNTTIDLGDLSQQIRWAKDYSRACFEMCKSKNVRDENCKALNTTLLLNKNNISLLNNYSKAGLNTFSKSKEILIEEIQTNIVMISQDMRFAAYYCNTYPKIKKISVVKNFEFPSMRFTISSPTSKDKWLSEIGLSIIIGACFSLTMDLPLEKVRNEHDKCNSLLKPFWDSCLRENYNSIPSKINSKNVDVYGKFLQQCVILKLMKTRMYEVKFQY